MRQADVFPYAEDANAAPRTDGLISSGSSIFLPTPGNRTRADQGNQAGSGARVAYVKNYVGDTDCVYANSVWHPVFAGDF